MEEEKQNEIKKVEENLKEEEEMTEDKINEKEDEIFQEKIKEKLEEKNEEENDEEINQEKEEENPLLTVCKEKTTHPFWCSVNGNYQCTKSKIECDCPEGYIRCKIQKYCVPGNRNDMCATFKIINNFCKIHYGNNYKMYDDGFCRLKDYRMPNQRVCPDSKVLCADLSCRDKYDDCIVSEVRKGINIRCVGQQLVENIIDCPSTITCSKENDVVCPNRKCVSSEKECTKITK